MMTVVCLWQDFALDPEESRMRAAAHHMVRFMTAGMALITCREPLHISINTNLKTAFLSALRVSVLISASVKMAFLLVLRVSMPANTSTSLYQLQNNIPPGGHSKCRHQRMENVGGTKPSVVLTSGNGKIS